MLPCLCLCSQLCKPLPPLLPHPLLSQCPACFPDVAEDSWMPTQQPLPPYPLLVLLGELKFYLNVHFLPVSEAATAKRESQ